MRLETYEQMMDLLPKLVCDRAAPDPVEDGRRLSVLAQIETVLAADKLTWDDLAAYLMPPALRPGDLVRMVNTIMQSGESLTEHAREFLADLQRQGRQGSDPMYLTERQSGWLWNLYRRALDRRTRAQQQHEDAQGDGSNVVYLEQRLELARSSRKTVKSIGE